MPRGAGQPGGQTRPGGSQTGGQKRGPTTGGDDGSESDGIEFFIPGQDGNLSWNTTAPIRSKPILVYIYSCAAKEGEQYQYAKDVERGMFRNKHIRKLARNFTCEKICIGDHEFLRKVKGREPVHGYLSTMKDQKLRKPQLAFLDSEGKLIKLYTDKKDMKKGAPGLLETMNKVKRENDRRIAEKDAE